MDIWGASDRLNRQTPRLLFFSPPEPIPDSFYLLE